MGGSMGDHVALVRALEKAQTFNARSAAEREVGTSFPASIRATMELVEIACRCGFPQDGSEDAFAWAERRVATFLTQCGLESDCPPLPSPPVDHIPGEPVELSPGSWGVYCAFADGSLSMVKTGLVYLRWTGPAIVGEPVFWNSRARVFNASFGLLMPGWSVAPILCGHEGLAAVEVRS